MDPLLLPFGRVIEFIHLDTLSQNFLLSLFSCYRQFLYLFSTGGYEI